MNKPYIICHMLQSLDGRIAGNIFSRPESLALSAIYGKKSKEFNADAIIYGRTTAKDMFCADEKLILDSEAGAVGYDDYVINDEIKSWIVVIDGKGSLAWSKEAMQHSRLQDRHLVVILNEETDLRYLKHLQDLGISYLFAGKDTLDMKVACDKLYRLCKINKAILQGGGIVNESFACLDLIDEISLIIVPIICGQSGVPTSFESGEWSDPISVGGYNLVQTECLTKQGIWLDYQINNQDA